jgi:hypothetical protein
MYCEKAGIEVFGYATSVTRDNFEIGCIMRTD